MKKIIALILSFCFLLPCAALYISAEDEVTYTLTLLEGNGERIILSDATLYTLPVSTAPEGKAFAGWQGKIGGKQVFLPAGAEVALDADATLSAVYVGMQMRNKPQIRYDIEGLRFLTMIDKADLAALQQYTEVGFGTLIVPRDSLKKNQALTHKTLSSANKLHLDVKTAGSYAEDEEIFWLAGSIGHVKTKNFCRSFLAAGYLSLTYTDGSTGYVYAPVKQTDTQPHFYKLSTESYNSATEIERPLLQRVMNAVVDLTLTCDKSNIITDIAYGPASAEYRPAYTARYEKNAERIVITVNEGSGLDYSTCYAGVILDGRVYDTAFEHDVKSVSISADGKCLHIAWMGEYSDFY